MTARAMHATNNMRNAQGGLLNGTKAKMLAKKAPSSSTPKKTKKRTNDDYDESKTPVKSTPAWNLSEQREESKVLLKDMTAFLTTYTSLMDKMDNYIMASTKIIQSQEEVIKGLRAASEIDTQTLIDQEINKITNADTNEEGEEEGEEEESSEEGEMVPAAAEEDDEPASIPDTMILPSKTAAPKKKKAATTTIPKTNNNKRIKTNHHDAATGATSTPANNKNKTKPITPKAPTKKLTLNDNKYLLAPDLARFMNRPQDKPFTRRSITTWFRSYLADHDLIQSGNSGRFEPNPELKRLLGKPKFTIGNVEDERGYALYNLNNYLEPYLEQVDLVTDNGEEAKEVQQRRSLRNSANSTPCQQMHQPNPMTDLTYGA